MPAWALGAADRLAALDEVDVFPGVNDGSFDVYTRLVARALGVPTALVTFVSDDRQFFASAVGLAEPWRGRGETPLSLSLCQFVVQGDDDLAVSDVARDGRVVDSRAGSAFGVGAYLGVPLRAPGGEPIGALCAIDAVARTWSSDDLAALHDIAATVTTAIALRVSEHRRARLATQASHELRSPITRLRLELEEHGLDDAVQSVDALSDRVDAVLRLARRGPLRETQFDLRALCDEIAAPRSLTVRGDAPVVVKGAAAVLHHVLRTLVDAVTGRPSLYVSADDVIAWVEVHGTPAADHDIATVRHLLGELGGRVLPSPSPDVAFEVVLPRWGNASDA